jgi:hypothetical protein
MKIRSAFVSNSSSSSFVILDEDQSHRTKIHFEGSIIKVPQTFGGTTEFDRSNLLYDDFGSKLNWAFLQAYYMDQYQSQYGDVSNERQQFLFEDEWWSEHSLKEFHNLVTFTKEILKEGLGLPKNFPIDIYLKDDEPNFGIWWNNIFELTDENSVPAFIDHQSMWMQNPQHLRIFEYNNLIKFLFNARSLILFKTE